jgi:hypothetical protein
LTNGLFLQKEIAPPIEGEALLNICTLIHPSTDSKRIIDFLNKLIKLGYFCSNESIYKQVNAFYKPWN